MGLDWHSQVSMAAEELLEEAKMLKEKYYPNESLDYVLKEHTPKYKKPCDIIGVSKMKDRPNFAEDIKEYVEKYKKVVEEGKASNPKYKEHWRNITVEEEMERVKDRFDCENCPLIKELQGADSMSSYFIGITVSSCDFRGKIIGVEEALDSTLQEEAYEEHDPDEMLDYADRLEEELEFLRTETTYLDRVSYEEYAKEWDEHESPFKERKMDKETYEKSLHWREEDIKRAIHWLRTLAKYGVSMGTSY